MIPCPVKDRGEAEIKLKKYNKLVNITKKKQTHRYREQTSAYQWGGGRREGQDRGRGLRGTNYYVFI